MSPALFPLVLAGHFVGDFVVQTDWQSANKTWPRDTEIYDKARALRAAGERPVVAERLVRQVVSRRSWKANQQHMLGYHLAILAGVAFGGLDATRVAVLLSVSWATHSFIDRRWPVRWLMRHTGSAAFAETSWGVMAVDQALHLSILCLLVAGLS